jgi:hypothetical protein
LLDDKNQRTKISCYCTFRATGLGLTKSLGMHRIYQTCYGPAANIIEALESLDGPYSLYREQPIGIYIYTVYINTTLASLWKDSGQILFRHMSPSGTVCTNDIITLRRLRRGGVGLVYEYEYGDIGFEIALNPAHVISLAPFIKELNANECFTVFFLYSER